MAKKRDREAVRKEERDPDAMEEDSSGDDFDMVNVDFEWFNFDADVDFHGTKTLLRQLLDLDAALLDVSALADLILSQPTVGSTVKVDGKENDAYALITALSVSQHAANAGMRGLVGYLSEKAGGDVAEALKLSGDGAAAAAAGNNNKVDVGLVLSERLINMPSEVAAPLYGMLVDELEAAVEDGEPYAFTHYLVLSRVYREVAPDPELAVAVAGREPRRSKKAREDGGGAPGPGEMSYFHPEDEVLRKYAAAQGSYPYTKEGEAVSESRRAFSEMGIRTEGYVMLIEAARFKEAVKAVAEYINSGA